MKMTLLLRRVSAGGAHLEFEQKRLLIYDSQTIDPKYPFHDFYIFTWT